MSGLKQILKPLSIICSITGLGCYGKSSTLKKFYIFVIAILYIFNFVYSFTALTRFRSIVAMCEGQFALAMVSLGCIATMISTSFFASDKFLTTIEEFDSNIEGTVPRRKLLLWFLLILSRLEMSLFIFYGMYELYQLKTYHFEFFVGVNIAQFQFDIARFSVYWLSSEFCVRFKILKLQISNLFCATKELSLQDSNIIFVHGKHYAKVVKKVSKLYSVLCDELKFMNDVYGLTMLFDVLICISFMTEFFTVMIRVFVIQKLDKDMWFFALWCSEYSVSNIFSSLLNVSIKCAMKNE